MQLVNFLGNGMGHNFHYKAICKVIKLVANTEEKYSITS